MKGNTCPTKPLRASSRATPPQMSDSLVGGFRSHPGLLLVHTEIGIFALATSYYGRQRWSFTACYVSNRHATVDYPKKLSY